MMRVRDFVILSGLTVSAVFGAPRFALWVAEGGAPARGLVAAQWALVTPWPSSPVPACPLDVGSVAIQLGRC